MPLLETKNLTKSFGGLTAVSDVSLAVERGTLHTVIGPNGAGKTTLFNLLCGTFRPTSGQVLLDGKDITGMPSHQALHHGIGRSFQISSLFLNLSVFEHARLAAQAREPRRFRLFGAASGLGEASRRAAEALELVGLHNQASATAAELSHGDKRRLELAMLVAPDADLLMLDEPTAGMASEQVPQLVEVIGRIRENAHKTLLLVEHRMDVVMSVSNRITVMHQGRVLAEGAPREITANPEVQAAYLGELYADVVQAH